MNIKRFKEHNENRNYTLRELTFKVDTQLVSRIQCHPLAKLQIKLLKINSSRPDELQAKKTNIHISQITEPLTIHSPGNKRYKYNSFLTKLHNPQTHDPSQILKQHRNVLMTISPSFGKNLACGLNDSRKMCLLMLMISAFPFYINLFLQYGTFHLKPASQLSFSRRLHCV